MTDAPITSPMPVNPAMYNLVLLATGLPMWLGGGLKVEGREHVPAHGAAIVAGNHALALDPFVIAHALYGRRSIQFMAKKELFANPLLGYVIRIGGSFPVDREGNDVGAVRTALRILQAGGLLGIFPQGTRGGQELQAGVALLALRGKASVVPAFVAYDRPARRWRVHFGPPLAPRGGIKAFTQQIGAAIEALGKGSS